MLCFPNKGASSFRHFGSDTNFFKLMFRLGGDPETFAVNPGEILCVSAIGFG